MPRAGTSKTNICDHKGGCIGTIRCYRQHDCGHLDCVAANTEAARKWRRKRAYGVTFERRPPGRSILHLRRLRAEGWTWPEIEDATGIMKANLQRLVNGGRSWVAPETEAKILGATVRPGKRDGAFIPNVQTKRQLQGLIRHGWVMSHLGEMLGISPQQVWVMLHRSEWVTEAMRRRVDDLARELMTVTPLDGPRKRQALRMAERYGWVSLFAWDDVTDPKERPKGVRAA